MTTDELSKKFRKEFDGVAWPLTYKVDADTYANVCQAIFDRYHVSGQPKFTNIAIGPNAGIMFHSIELILIRP